MATYKKSNLFLFLFIVSLKTLTAQTAFFKDSITVEAKVWSKDENKQVHYSDWKSNISKRVVDVIGWTKNSKSNNLGKVEGPKYFSTRKIKNRWTVIDPKGNAIIINAVNSIKLSKTDVVPTLYSNKQMWMSATIDSLRNYGFNMAGCWSDTGSIIEYNKNQNKNPFPYTVQLNLLNGYASSAKKLNPERKEESILSFILDPSFETYCLEQVKKISYLSTDKNLFGYFSDNELPFTNNECKLIMDKKNSSNQLYTFLQNWLKEKGINEANISNDQKQEFIGLLATQYYKIVGNAIKSADAYHLYIGSRIHSNAKNNPYIFKAANPYVDIISINYYGDWQPQLKFIKEWEQWSDKPYFITEFYTKAEESGMNNMSGAGWIVRTQKDRGVHYQNFCMQLLQSKNCVGWHWFRYQDNDPTDTKADDSNKDSNKGIIDINYRYYTPLVNAMKELNDTEYQLIKIFDKKNK